MEVLLLGAPASVIRTAARFRDICPSPNTEVAKTPEPGERQRSLQAEDAKRKVLGGAVSLTTATNASSEGGGDHLSPRFVQQLRRKPGVVERAVRRWSDEVAYD